MTMNLTPNKLWVSLYTDLYYISILNDTLTGAGDSTKHWGPEMYKKEVVIHSLRKSPPLLWDLPLAALPGSNSKY